MGSQPGDRYRHVLDKIEKIRGSCSGAHVLLRCGIYDLLRQEADVAVACVLLASASAISAGCFFSCFFLRDIAEAFTGLLLFPRRFLEETPFEVGPVYALMRGPDPLKAEAYLDSLPSDKKHCPEAVLARIELYRDILRRPEAALHAAKEYLALSGRRGNPCGKTILMSFADLASEKGDLPEICSVLNRELRRPIYTDREKNEIRLRLEALTEQIASRRNHHGSY